MSNVVRRALAYYGKNGLARSLRLLRKKATGRVPWNIKSPQPASERYLRDHLAAAERKFQNKPATKDGDGTTASKIPSSGRRLFGQPTVAIIGDLNLPQCKKYRVIQKIEALQDNGILAHHSHWQDIPRSLNVLQTATHAIFYRVTDTELYHGYITEARRLGVPASYDIDDPIFDEEVYGASKNLDFLSASERHHLVSQCGNYLAAMRAADNIIVSTPGLKARAELLTGRPCFVWRNAVDAETRHAAKIARHAHSAIRNGSELVIGYASGSRAHEADFPEAEDAIVQLLAANPGARLAVIGHHNLSEKLKAYAEQITEVPFTDYESYLVTLSHVDINVVPLLQDGFNDCKSAIRFLDAAIAGVPTIASKTGDFVNIVEHGRTGLLAGSALEWQSCLSLLAGDAKKRKEMGARAKAFAEKSMAAATIARALDPALLRQIGKNGKAA